MRYRHAPFALFLSLAMLSAAPAYADDDDDRPAARSAISQATAVRIARGYGMVRVQNMERDDGGWEIEGRDHRGRQLKVSINRQGRVTQVDRDDDDDD